VSTSQKIQICYCSGWILTGSWIPKIYRTFSSFQQLFSCPHLINGLGVMTPGSWPCCWIPALDSTEWLRILKLWRHIEKATQTSLNTKFIDNHLIFPMNWVTPWSGTQNDNYGHLNTAVRHIAVGGRWKFHVKMKDQHHLARGAIIQIRWALHHATEMTW
jgi:hypothetical protein